jgi:hypothetical protein
MIIEQPDRGPWIQTFTGRRFHYADMQPSDVHILDIAHALSMLCRYGGHSRMFYSVAEHSVLLCDALRAAGEDVHVQLAGLMHDSTEAYCVDIPRPLKRMLSDYKAFENRAWDVIASRFGLMPELPAIVHEYDTRMLITERPVLFESPIPWPRYEEVKPLPGVLLHCAEPWKAKLAFLKRFHFLTNNAFNLEIRPDVA